MTRRIAVLLLTATPLFGAYTYYHTDILTSINTNNWYVNGAVSATANGLTSTNGGGGSLISKIGVPGDYEIKTTLNIDPTTPYEGEFFHYLRATSDAKRSPSSTGSFYSVGIEAITYSSEHLVYTATLTVHKRVGGVLTQLASVHVCIPNGSELRSILRGSRLDVWLNGVWHASVTDTSLPTGQPGIGVRYTSVNTISRVDLGQIETVAPSPVSAQSIATYPLPNSVEMQWQGAADDANGIGVAHYLVYRNSQLLGETSSAEFTDDTVTYGANYQYAIVARDYHLNDSTQTTFNVVTPPDGTIEPRQPGIRPTGAYWGADGEQLDMLSGNLNFSLPLITAMGRNGGGATFRLSYNSQNWRRDSAATWKLGRDVGYGFGWRFQAGSITPYWEGPWTIHHYKFIDSTGAEYRLDQPDASQEKWTSKEGIYVTYDRVSNRLYFPDGSFWVMGAVAAGTEQDAGTRYPSIIQDSNGNTIRVRYQAGVGTAWEESSARIHAIEDVRAIYSGSHGWYQSYHLDYNDGAIPHLSTITYSMGLQTTYTFSYAANQPLISPFSPPVSFGTTHLLSSVTQTGTNLTHYFNYDTNNNAGELNQITFPYGGYLVWYYRDFTYLGNRTIREVHSRYLCKTSGAPWTANFIWRDDYTDANGTVHYATVMWGWDGTNNIGQKAWYFSNTLDVWYTGLLYQFDEGPANWTQPTRRQQYTWTRDAALNPYVASVVTTLDPDTDYEKISRTEQTLDNYGRGNVTETRIYNYGQFDSPYRTYNTTYLDTSAYTARHIYNRVLTSTVTDGTNQFTVVSNTYDGGYINDRTGLRNHDTANYGTGMATRGNVTQRVANGVTTNLSYDITGMVTSANDGQGHSVAIDPEPNMNNTVPGIITPNSQQNLQQTLDYASWLAVTVNTHPNSNYVQTAYDNYARPASTTTVQGATTTYTYNVPERWTKATTNNRWTKTTTDGLGRTVKVETGYGATTVSVVDTEYEICACSPMGKVKKVSMPYAPGGTVYWTVYDYDGLGRTVRIRQPNSSGNTDYVYQGNTVTVTDPAGHWKKYTLDVLGNLVKVTEPDPSLGDVDTDYTYNLRGQLTLVEMPRGANSQTRTFNYDLTTGRLSSATNPENGTVSYTYNADGTIATRTDAKSQQVQYSYDTYGRRIQIRRYSGQSPYGEITCQRTDVYYDTHPFYSGYTQNGWGRLAATRWGGTSCTGGEWKEYYSYTASGLATKKKLYRGSTAQEAAYTYDTEGRLVSTQYPNNGLTFTYSFDSMGRPIKLTDNQSTPVDWAKDVVYNAAGQMTQMKYTRNTSGSLYYTETRQYNILGQLTQLTVPNKVNRTYTFSATDNDGRITQMTDAISGETIDYQYDSLKRLSSAATTGPQWGQSFSYDGFGNMLSTVATKGSAPSVYLYPDPSNNRLGSGYQWDANGNLTARTNTPTMTMTYDVENRMVQATHSLNGTESYVYDPAGRRVWKSPSTTFFYGVDGNMLSTGSSDPLQVNVYFAGKLIWEKANPTWAAAVVQDRLGSVVALGDGWSYRYFPYGEEATPTSENHTKFATYYRDQTTALDYAQNRYYSTSLARFTTPDPYQASGGPADPQSWNRYAYVKGDPVNYADPTGEFRIPVIGGLIGWIGRLIGFGGEVGRAIPPFGGSVTFDPQGFARAAEWKRDTGSKVSEWDLLIAAAIAAGKQRAEESGSNIRYPAYLLVTGDCYRRTGFGGSVLRIRQYTLYANTNERMTGPVVVTEQNYVVTGQLRASNTSWPGGVVDDWLSRGSGDSITQYQTFTAWVYGGIDVMPAPVPVMVRDPGRGDFGTLGIYMGRDVVIINGDDGQVNGQYRWCNF